MPSAWVPFFGKGQKSQLATFKTQIRLSQQLSSDSPLVTSRQVELLENSVNLVAKLPFQMLCIVLVSLIVPKILQFFLKCPQRNKIFFPRTSSLDVGILEVRINQRPASALELHVRHVKLFVRKFPGLGKEG